MGRAVALVLLVLVCLGMRGDDPPRLSFIRPPAIVPDGYPIPFRLRLPPHDDNRRLAVAAVDRGDGEQVAYSQRDVDGGSAALQSFTLLLPRGRLIVTARVFGVQGVVLGLASTPVWVRGRFDEPEDEPEP
jgi:hypothetical protein